MNRYKIEIYKAKSDNPCLMTVTSSDGEWVKAKDVETLQGIVIQLNAQVTAYRALVTNLRDSFRAAGLDVSADELDKVLEASK